MSNKKCHKCGVIDSVHRKNEGKSKLVWDFGPRDEKGLQMHFIYCRSCGSVNIYKPGWFGNLKFDSYINTSELYQKGEFKLKEMSKLVGKKIEQAMIEDKILTND